MTDSNPLKRCSKCGAEKPATAEFWYVQKLGKFGLSSRCKSCLKESDRQKHFQTYVPKPKPARRTCKYCQQTKPVEELSRYGSSGYKAEVCNECYKSRRLEYAGANSERRLAATRRWRRRNPEKCRAKARVWFDANPDKVREYARAAYLRNPKAALAHARNYKARKWGAEGKYSAADVRQIVERQNGACYYCTAPLSEGYHVDHYIPLSKGGSNWPSNLVAACQPCNNKKKDKLPWEFDPSIPLSRSVPFPV